MLEFTPNAQAQLTTVCKSLAQCVKEYFRSPENRLKFEQWYFQKYGKKYTWSK